MNFSYRGFLWRRQDSNLRPSGYEPDELPTAPLRDLIGPQRYKFLAKQQGKILSEHKKRYAIYNILK